MAVPASSSVALLTPDNNDNGTLTEEFVSGLAQGGSWTFGGGPRVLTWSLNINEDYRTYPPGPAQPGPGGEWEDSPGLADAVARALAGWAAVADLRFQRIDSGRYYFESSADLAVTLTGDDLDRVFGGQVAGLAHFPDSDFVESDVYSDATGIDRTTYPGPEGDVFLDNDEEHFDFLDPGGAGYTVILHELGHALGLKHPFDDGANGRPSFEDLGIGALDLMRHTVMSYDIVAPAPGERGFAETPMPLDILAIQHIYGANLAYETGDNTYALANASYRTIWDAGGTDLVTASSWTRPGGVTIDLRGGEFSGRLSGARRTAIAYGAIIENARGSAGGDEIIGSGVANRLDGGAGDDFLNGRGGNDRLIGRAGSDRLSGGAGNDVLVCNAGDLRLHGGNGLDTLRLVGASLDLRINSGTGITDIERIKLTGDDGDRLTVDAASVLDLSTTGNTLMVIGNAADTVRIADSFVDRGITGDFHRYQMGAAVLLVDSDIAIV